MLKSSGTNVNLADSVLLCNTFPNNSLAVLSEGILHYHSVLEISWICFPGKAIFHFYCLVSYLYEAYTGKVASNVYYKGYHAPSLVMDAVKHIFFSFSWVFVCTGFPWKLLGDTHVSITRPQDLPQDSFVLYHGVLKAILSPLPMATCSLKNIAFGCVILTTGRAGGYVHTQGSSSHDIIQKARGKHHNYP